MNEENARQTEKAEVRDTSPIEHRFEMLEQKLNDLNILTDKFVQKLNPVLCVQFNTSEEVTSKDEVRPDSKVVLVLEDFIKKVETITATIEDARMRLDL